MMDSNQILQLCGLVFKFSQVKRATYHPDGETQETDAEHTLMLILVCCQLADAHPDLEMNTGRIAEFAAVHDLPEVYAGDTNTMNANDEVRWDKEQRELAAMKLLQADYYQTWLMKTLEEYERQEAPEARLVRYVDKILPKAAHHLNQGASLRKDNVSKADLVRAHREQGEKLRMRYPELADVVGPLFESLALLSEKVLLDEQELWDVYRNQEPHKTWLLEAGVQGPDDCQAAHNSEYIFHVDAEEPDLPYVLGDHVLHTFMVFSLDPERRT